MKCFALVALLLLPALGEQWIVQNFYNGIACDATRLASVTAWRSGLCTSSADGKFRKYVCSPGATNQRLRCDDYLCTVNCTAETSIGADRCGNTGSNPATATGSFYVGCNTVAPADQPPTIDNVADSVYETFVYQNNSCGLPLFQYQAFRSGYCTLKTVNTCLSRTSATTQLYPDDVCRGNITDPLTTSTPGGGCNSGGESRCRMATDPTTTPAPGSPTAAPLIASCDQARTKDQCSGTVAISPGLFTLPIGSSASKCCVWCGNDRLNSTDGTCREPSWSPDTSCTCPAGGINGTLTAPDLVILGCSAGIQEARCKCISRFPGLPACGPNTGGVPTTPPTPRPASDGSILVFPALFMLFAILY